VNIAHRSEILGGDVPDLAVFLGFGPLHVLLEDHHDVALAETDLHVRARFEREQGLSQGSLLVGIELIA
jgi:hypothetical protein